MTFIRSQIGRYFHLLEFFETYRDVLSQVFDISLIIWSIIITLYFSLTVLKEILWSPNKIRICLFISSTKGSINGVIISIEFHMHKVKFLVLDLWLLSLRYWNNCLGFLNNFITKYSFIANTKSISHAHYRGQEVYDTLLLIVSGNNCILNLVLFFLLNLSLFNILNVILKFF